MNKDQNPQLARSSADEDVEGHRRLTGDENVEGPVRVTGDEDVEGHGIARVQPPRDLDIER